MYGLRAMREGAGIKDTDTSTWDLGNAGRKARQSAFERALAGLMFACSTVHKGGSCTAGAKVCLMRPTSQVVYERIAGISRT